MNGVDERRRRGRRLHDRRFRPEPGRLHDDVLRGRLAELALRQCRDRRRLRLSRRADGVRHRRDPGQIRRQRGLGDRQRHLHAEGRQRRRHLLSPRSGTAAAPTRSSMPVPATPRSTFARRPSQYEAGGGGFVSYAYGIFGGFTIANGVDDRERVGRQRQRHADRQRRRQPARGQCRATTISSCGPGAATTPCSAAPATTISSSSASLTSADIVNGGDGTDTLVLQGAYAAP